MILWFIFGIFINFISGAMIHSSEHSEIPANITLTKESIYVYDQFGQPMLDGPFGLTLFVWTSQRLCSKNSTALQLKFEISTKKSSCIFLLTRSSSEYKISSQIHGNIQWQKYEFKKDEIYNENYPEILTNLTIYSDGSVDILGHQTELKCLPNFFVNMTSALITIKESPKCRSAIIVEGLEAGDNFVLPDDNILHNYYFDTYALIATFSSLCAVILLLDLANVIYFCL